MNQPSSAKLISPAGAAQILDLEIGSRRALDGGRCSHDLKCRPGDERLRRNHRQTGRHRDEQSPMQVGRDLRGVLRT